MKTITALTVAALAEAAAPYGIESFDDVLEPLWKGIRLLRGKVLAAFLKVRCPGRRQGQGWEEDWSGPRPRSQAMLFDSFQCYASDEFPVLLAVLNFASSCPSCFACCSGLASHVA